MFKAVRRRPPVEVTDPDVAIIVEACGEIVRLARERGAVIGAERVKFLETALEDLPLSKSEDLPAARLRLQELVCLARGFAAGGPS